METPLSRIFGTTCLDSLRIPSTRWLKFMSGRRRKRHGMAGRRRFGGGRCRGLLSAQGQRRRGERREEFFGPDVAGDAPVHLAGPMRKRKPEALFTSRGHVGSRPKKLGASCSPRRSDEQRVCLPLLSWEIQDKGVEMRRHGFDDLSVSTLPTLTRRCGGRPSTVTPRIVWRGTCVSSRISKSRRSPKAVNRRKAKSSKTNR